MKYSGKHPLVRVVNKMPKQIVKSKKGGVASSQRSYVDTGPDPEVQRDKFRQTATSAV